MLVVAAVVTTLSAVLDLWPRRGYELLGPVALVGVAYVAVAWLIALWAMLKSDGK
jgi:hypothetical protein